jgi:hypothetical protein
LCSHCENKHDKEPENAYIVEVVCILGYNVMYSGTLIPEFRRNLPLCLVKKNYFDLFFLGGGEDIRTKRWNVKFLCKKN